MCTYMYIAHKEGKPGYHKATLVYAIYILQWLTYVDGPGLIFFAGALSQSTATTRKLSSKISAIFF